MTMPERHNKIAELFLAACDLAGDARAEFLAKACGDDADLRSAVEKLLVHDSDAKSVADRLIVKRRSRAKKRNPLSLKSSQLTFCK